MWFIESESAVTVRNGKHQEILRGSVKKIKKKMNSKISLNGNCKGNCDRTDGKMCNTCVEN